MYPDSLLQWLGYLAVVFGVLGVCLALAWWLIHRGPDDRGEVGLRVVLEVFSALFVCTGLLVAVYSDLPLVRALAGLGIIVLTSALTYSWMKP